MRRSAIAAALPWVWAAAVGFGNAQEPATEPLPSPVPPVTGEVQAAPVGRVGATNPLPLWVTYERFFLHVQDLEEAADEQERLGDAQAAAAWRSYLQTAAGLTADESATLKQLAAACIQAVKEKDAAIDLVATSLREQDPAGQAATSVSPEILDLWQQRVSVVESHVQMLRDGVGEERFLALDAYVEAKFAPGLERVATQAPGAAVDAGTAATTDLVGGLPTIDLAAAEPELIIVQSLVTVSGLQARVECSTSRLGPLTRGAYVGVGARCSLSEGSLLGLFDCPFNSDDVFCRGTVAVRAGHSYTLNAGHLLYLLPNSCSTGPDTPPAFGDVLGYGWLQGTPPYSGQANLFGGSVGGCWSSSPLVIATGQTSITLHTLTIEPAVDEVLPGNHVTFTTTFAPPRPNPGVIWTLVGPGTLNNCPESTTECEYIAPDQAEVAADATVTLKACAVAEPQVCGQVTFKVPKVVFTIDCQSPWVAEPSNTQVLKATLDGPRIPHDVVWNPTNGSIQKIDFQTARYTPPVITEITQVSISARVADDLYLFSDTCKIKLIPPIRLTAVTGLRAEGREVPATITGSGFGNSVRVRFSDPAIQFTPTEPHTATSVTGTALVPFTSAGQTVTVTVESTTDAISPTPASIQVLIPALPSGPLAQLSPSSLTFDAQVVATTSAPRTIALTNFGTAPLALTNIAVNGDFAQQNDCGGSVLPGRSCTFTVTFQPVNVGVRTGSLVLTDNAPGSPHTVALGGIGKYACPGRCRAVRHNGGTVHQGESTTLSAPEESAGYTYAWYQGDGTTSPLPFIVASITVTPPLGITAYWVRTFTGNSEFFDSELAYVTVLPPLSVTPTQAIVFEGQTQQFTSSEAVTWSVQGAGQVNDGGLYTAPASVLGTETAVVQACSKVNALLCAQAIVSLRKVIVDEPPVAAITASCRGRICTLDGGGSSDDNGIVSWSWSFGDGTGAVGSGVTHTYAANGTYAVELTVADTAGQTSSTTSPVTVFDRVPTARFTFDNCTGRVCTFDGRGSTDDFGIVSWSWSFGDGSTGSGPVTSHTYAADGTYNVQLTVTDTARQSSSIIRAITVSDLPPIAGFNATCSEVTCTFDGAGSTDDFAVTSWSWTFGDGTTASGAQTSHAYATSGTYTVQLTVADAAGQTNSTTRTVIPRRPAVAAFTVSCTGRRCDVNASASSADLGIASYSWNFGDGSAAGSGKTTSHLYAVNNAFTITLAVADTSGATAQTAQTVTVADNPPTAGFSAVCIDRTCHPDAETSGDDVGIVNYTWSWGDGQPNTSGGSPASAPSHTYASYGTYTISLTVRDVSDQTATVSHVVFLSQGPTAAFTFTCKVRSCDFNASSSSSAVPFTGYHWQWGDETTSDATVATQHHDFGAQDIFTVFLEVADAAGRTAGVSHAVSTIDALPTANFFVVCADRACRVDARDSRDDRGIVSYAWTWGDGSAPTTGASKTADHTYASYGTFTIGLAVTDTGDQTATTNQATTLTPGPTAAFTVTCTNLTCNVNASASTGAITNYHWDWDDETTTDTAVAAVSHTYAFDATFSIHLRVTDSSDRFADVTHAVTVQSPPSRPTAALVVTCTNRTCNVDASGSTGTIATYHWDWGDELANDYTVPTASHTFTWDDTFSIHLRVTDSAGRFADVTHAVTVRLPPSGPTASFTAACTGRSCSFDGSASTSNVPIVSYHWDWDDESTTDTAGPMASHFYPYAATFLAHLAVTDANGAIGRITKSVTAR